MEGLKGVEPLTDTAVKDWWAPVPSSPTSSSIDQSDPVSIAGVRLGNRNPGTIPPSNTHSITSGCADRQQGHVLTRHPDRPVAFLRQSFQVSGGAAQTPSDQRNTSGLRR